MLLAEVLFGLIIGLPVFIVGIMIWRLRNGIRTEATVTDNKVTVRANTSPTNYTQITFTDHRGVTQQATFRLGLPFGFYKAGSKVPIIYHAEQPNRCMPVNKNLLRVLYFGSIISIANICAGILQYPLLDYPLALGRFINETFFSILGIG
ncbi:MAG TPA: hypothetical protein PKC24_15075 [Cyclobacteriaceae bacterium]|nr:hypothetical protein [Cyclobacteriaceae bacterium]